jgi:hypothetical protein
MPLSLDSFTKFAQFLVVDRANCNAGSVILCSDYLEPYKSQLPKRESSLSKKRGVGSCYADRDSGTLGNGGGGDQRFGNKESDVIEGVERADGNWYECNCN